MAKDLLEENEVDPINLDKYKMENDLWNPDKLIIWKQEIMNNNDNLDVPGAIFPVRKNDGED
jgi:hypothetical protein